MVGAAGGASANGVPGAKAAHAPQHRLISPPVQQFGELLTQCGRARAQEPEKPLEGMGGTYFFMDEKGRKVGLNHTFSLVFPPFTDEVQSASPIRGPAHPHTQPLARPRTRPLPARCCCRELMFKH